MPGLPIAALPSVAVQPDRPGSLSTVLRERFGNVSVHDCGVLNRDRSAGDRARVHRCVREHLATGEPFIVQQDRNTAVSAIVSTGGESGAIYQLASDPDPCCGGCPERGWTTLQRCASLVPIADCSDSPSYLPWCYGCVNEKLEESWAAGPLWIETDLRFAPVFGMTMGFAGACSVVRDQLLASWGLSPDDVWLDPERGRRARLDRVRCELRLERYAELDEWLADSPDAIVPLGLIGRRASVLRARLVGMQGVEDDGDGIHWTERGLGRHSGHTELSANVERGRITLVHASAQTDRATIEAIRARLMARFGTPFQDDVINAGATRYTAWHGANVVELSVAVDRPEFELMAHR